MTTERKTLNQLAKDYRAEQETAAQNRLYRDARYLGALAERIHDHDPSLSEEAEAKSVDEELGRIARSLLAMRATPPAEGPVVWVGRDLDGQMCLFGEPPHFDGSEWKDRDEIEGVILDGAEALGLAPGECKRVRLTVMEGVE